MTNETPTIPITETPEVRRQPMHLRYLGLLRSNAEFRRLWIAQLVSEIGDWFYTLAVYDLVLQITHSGKAVSYAIMIQTLPWFFTTPLAGQLADRFPRRNLMIIADVARGFVVLGLIAAQQPSRLWLIYVLLGLETLFTSVFEPSRNAMLPNVVSDAELLPANALSSATWAMALSSGAALGGVVMALLGRNSAFVINSLSFFASAFLIYRMKVHETHHRTFAEVRESGPFRRSFRSLREGLDYFHENPRVVALVLSKTGLGFISGALLLLTIFGERVFSIRGANIPFHSAIRQGGGPLAVGILYSARGIGAGLGPLVGDHLVRGRVDVMWKAISICFFGMGLAYVGLGFAPGLFVATLAVAFAHANGANVWVMATTLLQLEVPDRFRGRIFAADAGLLMVSVAGANYLIGIGFDNWHMTPRVLAVMLGCLLALPGLAWLPVQAKWGKKNAKT
jgi:predicted MFS family arabinose efflux permease